MLSGFLERPGSPEYWLTDVYNSWYGSGFVMLSWSIVSRQYRWTIVLLMYSSNLQGHWATAQCTKINTADTMPGRLSLWSQDRRWSLFTAAMTYDPIPCSLACSLVEVKIKIVTISIKNYVKFQDNCQSDSNEGQPVKEATSAHIMQHWNTWKLTMWNTLVLFLEKVRINMMQSRISCMRIERKGLDDPAALKSSVYLSIQYFIW